MAEGDGGAPPGEALVCGLTLSGVVALEGGCPTVSLTLASDRSIAWLTLEQPSVTMRMALQWTGSTPPQGTFATGGSGASGFVTYRPDDLLEHQREFWVVYDLNAAPADRKGDGALALALEGSDLRGTARLELLESVQGQVAESATVTAVVKLP